LLRIYSYEAISRQLVLLEVARLSLDADPPFAVRRWRREDRALTDVVQFRTRVPRRLVSAHCLGWYSQ
jgi:hypothetical protein